MIELRPITPENHRAARRMKVRDDQAHLVAPIESSLADAFVYSTSSFMVAFEGDVPVGYVLVQPFDEDGKRVVNIVRVMIDADHQGRGLGRELLEGTIRWVSAFEPTPERLRISTLPDNAVALGLYRSLGFQARGMEEGEIALYMDYPARAEGS